ncbi:magnesium/cobalt transporter CorA [Kordia algicida OT-1]|uniref:Magnesium transport protein CorA n=1 Tax=Kordia algicida OT-1 TaxID=391587 RepID=A9DPU7_9FLAO|nr:magnesium/cobalt transporter CorA [Kordia algicida]EDP97525.1 magnesium and cobalt transport protein CorA [Kordia algicida OT-1]
MRIPSKKDKKSKKATASKSLGKAPGELVYTGDKENLETLLEVHEYTIDEHQTYETKQIKKVFDVKGNNRVTWINVNGLNNAEDITKIGEYFKIHPLILEDIVNTNQRPKIDEFDNYIFVVLKMLYHNKENELLTEHISFIIGTDYVLTFQETDEDIFNPIRKRFLNQKSRLRSMGSDYLAFSLMDAIIDNYAVVIETFGTKVELIEDELFLESPREDISRDIQYLKQDLLRLRRSILPSREVISRIVKSESELITVKTYEYLKDLQDHILQINDNIDLYREMVWGLMDMHMTTISNKMNGIMKVLTIISTIFIPLTFIVGVYGMNFNYIPELQYKYGYFALWGIMIILFLALLIFFRRKKWL